MQESTMKTMPRIELVDALRGFAVMAIFLVHCLEHFIFPVYPTKALQPEWLNILDEGVFSVVFSLFAGKSYAIFALLFGFTFCVQYVNRKAKGLGFGWRFLWRLILLAGFAAINALFFPAGDVLLLFSIVGLFLLLVQRCNNTIILIFAIVLLLQPIEWFHYGASLVYPPYRVPDLGVVDMYKTVREYTAQGNFLEFAYGNITLGQKASLLWAIGAGRFLQTAGLFMLGLLIGRKQLFVSSADNVRFWTRTLIICAILFCPIYQLKVLLMDNADVGVVKQSVGVVMDMWQKLAFTGVLISSFFLLYQTEAFRRLTSSLRFYGKMSLTNYISQSILGALIFFPFGLYLAPYCGYTVSLLIGIVLFLLQVQFCKWWLKGHKQGPLESLWHKLTWIGSKR